VTPAEQSLRHAFEARAGRSEPSWLADARAAAFAALGAAGLPTPRHEDWRFTSLAGLSAVSFAPAPELEGVAETVLARRPAPEGPRLVFENGRFRPDLSTGGVLPPGAALGSLAEALLHAPEAVRPHLGRLARPDGLAFTAANAALLEDGAFLLLPPGAQVESPIELVFVTGAPGRAVAVHPRVLVLASEGARATLAEVYLGSGDPYLVNAVTEIVLGEGAVVEHLKLQDEGPRAFHVSAVFAEQAAGARLDAHALALGAQLSRSEVRARLVGEGGELSASGLHMADGTRITDSFSWVEHAVPRCTTTESYKAILDGRARGVFSGRIRVMPGAQKTNARQMSSNLLLSEDAVVDTKPQLEIFADDVKCGHGGTVGQLDETALFYLRSRGVGEAEARSLLIWAFAAEMVDRVRAPGLRAWARERVAARLPAGAKLLEAA
jgi:Fe-S cluster assembly protein SufD